MSSYSDQVRDLVIGSLWSMWVEFGVSGWERHHQDSALDLEAVILTTARIGHRDARLRNEALDWCVAHGRIASAVRLKRLLAIADQPTHEAFGWFACTVNSHTHLRWPGATSPMSFTPTGRSSAPTMIRPALLQLRLRTLWGVSARAEVLRVMLIEGERFTGVSEVAAAAAYGKDAVADALENLHRGGLLEAAGVRNQRVFRLRRGEQVLAVLEPLPDPSRSWPWQDVLPIMAGFMEATDLVQTPPMARAADIQRRWREWQPELARLGLTSGALGAGGDFLRDYEDFTLRALKRWSGSGSSQAGP
jgi:hypothetical protein